ncbi:hypothetical protein JRQ81_003711 [Phrynocephalus forsythii]|uniref:G-protein coupled receptors family 1 profile domain-containing protein n=1 Tax=Phrynocephalus forsythii TaxID=171643 RepID=A0A9Q1AXP4_9SAUR|nr:hypothetical protein JRQ81_003711 [Phrynocephalus forsythii]
MTMVSGFILLGISSHQDLYMVFFTLFLIIYLISLLGNLTIILVIRLDDHLLHTPMYYLLSHLSLVDICGSGRAWAHLGEAGAAGGRRRRRTRRRCDLPIAVEEKGRSLPPGGHLLYDRYSVQAAG